MKYLPLILGICVMVGHVAQLLAAFNLGCRASHGTGFKLRYSQLQRTRTSKVDNLSDSVQNAPFTIQSFGFNSSIFNSNSCKPFGSVDEFRSKFGTTNSVWGDWSAQTARKFYRDHLPRALLVPGAFNLTLEDRARLAATSRHALRMYTRERCSLPARLSARVYDGIRHLRTFGYWKSDGMTWEEVCDKYRRVALNVLSCSAPDDEINKFMLQQIIQKSCTTNGIIDSIASSHASREDCQQNCWFGATNYFSRRMGSVTLLLINFTFMACMLVPFMH